MQYSARFIGRTVHRAQFIVGTVHSDAIFIVRTVHSPRTVHSDQVHSVFSNSNFQENDNINKGKNVFF